MTRTFNGSMRRMGMVLTAAAWGAMLAPPAGVAAEAATAESATAFSLDEGCRLLAEQVLTTLTREQLPKTVAVGAFTAAPRLESSGGVGLGHRVRQALHAVGIATQPSGALQLSGKFRDAVESQPFAGEGVALRIEYLIQDARDNELLKGVINAFGDAPLEIAGGTADLRPRPDGDDDGEARRRQEAIRASFERPAAFVAGQETRPSRGSPFGLEVRVDARGVAGAAPATPVLRDGRSFVQLAKGDQYRVRLRNATKDTVLVSLTIDGLDAFTFSEDPDDQGRKVHFVLAPGTVRDVPGWFITKKRSEAFRITDYAKSEAVKMFGSTADVGQITATFYEAVKIERTYTVLVPESIGTERGNKIETNYERVRLQEGRPLATVTVRYEKAS